MSSGRVMDPSLSSRRELLEQALRRRAREQVSVAPLSRGQKALWFLHQSAPASAAYHVAFAARIRSVPNLGALRRAFQALLDRHGLLRATFKRRGGEPVQEIPGHREVAFAVTDAAGWSEDELKARVRAVYRRPFDLEDGPVLRVDVFSRDADDHVLLVTVHHIAYDGWSLWINLDEIRQLYAAEVSGQPSPLRPFASTYPAYVRRQEAMLAGPEGERLWEFWRQELLGELPTLDIPTDRPRPPVQTYDGASEAFSLDRELTRQLKAFAQAHEVTPFTLLLAAFQVLLHRYSGQEEILVGSPTLGRGDAAFAEVVGYFVNPVVLRGRLAERPSFASFLRATRDTVLRALEHQDYPFPLLVERLQPRRDPSHSPLFQASFVLQKAQRSGGTIDLLGWREERRTRYHWGGLDLEYFDLPQQEGQFDLELEMLEAAGSFFGAFKYNTDLYEAATLRRMAGHFQNLLQSIVDDPSRSVTELPMLTRPERERLLGLPAPHPDRDPRCECLHRRFERQVEASPDATAVVHEDARWSYRELNARANRLAHRLQSLGVGPDVLVGLCVERSLDLVVGILGILKAGGAYLPLDPASPRERLAFILEDSAVPLLLTQQALAANMPASAANVLYLDALEGDDPPSAAENPESAVGLEHLAYVIYTSGSTGKPKGAEITHENVSRLFLATDAWFHFDERDVWTLFHSSAFDFSVWELWGALLYGGRLVVVPYWVSRSPGDFLELLARERVTVLNQTPSAFKQLMEAEARAATPPSLALRYVVFGGEALDVQSLAPWFDRHGDATPRLVNMYGITETTVHVTYRPLSRADLTSPRSVIGVPIPDVQVYILDPHREPAPIGVAGEIYVGGAGLARGYRERPELNRERFVSHSFDGGPPVRLYRTGDLARRLPGGDVEYLGRIDTQVKIRGFRIELGEIEAVLCQHPEVKTAVVMLRDGPGGDKRLVAYVVGPAAPADLRAFLMARLPAYMVPSAFVPLDSVPLTNNGKVDYRALKAPEAARIELERSFVPPRDAIEQRLIALWERVLDVRPLGVRDNFFEVGGHSLLAVHLMAEIEAELGRKLPIATLFRNPTVEQLGELLRSDDRGDAGSPLVAIQPRGDGAPFFCVAGGGGSVFYFYALARHMGEERPFYGLQAIGLDGEREPLTRVEEMAAEYVRAIRAAQPHGPYHLGGHCFGGLVAFEMAQQLRAQGEQVALVALVDVPAPHSAGEAVAVEPEAYDEAAWLAKLGEIMSETIGAELGIDASALQRLDAAGRLAHFKERLQAAGLLPPGAPDSSVRGLLGVFVANTRARYAPREVQPLPIALYRAGEAHRDYDYSAAEDPGRRFEESSLGWSALVGGPVEVEVVPGNHITMLSEPHVGTLARRLAARLPGAAAVPGSERAPITDVQTIIVMNAKEQNA
jgi:amino acid adenylation domain-containing protein